SSTTYSYDNTPGFYPTSLFNADFGWEKTTKFELAIETSLWKGRINLDASYYQNISSGQLIGYALPSITGFNSIQSNSPAKVRNTGLEIVLSSSILKTAHFSWDANLNFTLPQNKLLAFPAIESSAYYNTYAVGKSIYAVKKLQSTGVNPQTGIYSYSSETSDGMPTITRDGKFIKEVGQQFYGGVHNSFNYKHFSLDFLVQFVRQTGWDDVTGFYSQPGSRFGNQPVRVMQRWQSPGQLTGIQKFSQLNTDVYQAYNNIRNNGDDAITDCSYLRLKNVYLSYEMPGTKGSLRHLTLFLQGQNVYTLSPFKGADPQNSTFGGVRFLPSLRVLSIGLKLII
ncbi:MAG: SusC/RagA family TonB-linked outer membrane protein, partial [Marmoricola sp.]|nr:SusC/RagA family TonB-linked outer membrane protein [Marmoricola sp.]